MISSPAPFYVTGGTLASDAPCYVERRADRDLYEGLTRGEFCYVLTSRQMGKSSLMVRAADRLRHEGAAVAVLDLTAAGQNLSPEQWYDGLLGDIGRQLNLEAELEDFWLANTRLGPLPRCIRALREVVLPRRAGRVVIFVDEIDAVRGLPFSTDEFFAAIRELYNRRAEDAELGRLTFCLLGVATPSDLIRDTRTTPFNVGRRVELRDFTEDEAAALAQGLRREPAQAVPLLRRVLHWTGGHPYLTQRLCQVIADTPAVTKPADVDRVCGELFLSNRARERDDNLLFVRERLLHSEVDLAGLLDLYGQVWRRGVPDDETNPVINVLQLSGVARVVNGRLRVRNRIYGRVFDRRWVEANMPDAEKLRQRRAYRRGLLRATGIALLVLAIAGGLRLFAWRQSRAAYAAGLVQQLLRADTAKVPAILDEIEGYRDWADPLLREELARAADDSQQKLHVSLALLAADPGQKDFLSRRLLEASPREIAVLRDSLAPYRGELLDRLWQAVARPPRGHEQQRLRAAYALAAYDPDSPRWDAAGDKVVQDLVRESANPAFLGIWLEGLRPVKARFLAPLAALFRERSAKRAAGRAVAANILADYAADQPDLLADLLMDADDHQFLVLFPQVPAHGEAGLAPLLAEVNTQPPAGADEADKETLARRKANAAAALFRLGHAVTTWPLLKHGDDPRVRSYLIQRLGPLGVNPQAIIQRLGDEQDLTIRRALLLSLGAFDQDQLPPAERAALTPQLLELFRADPDAGLHGAAEWLLRQWGERDKLRDADERLQQAAEQRLGAIKEEFAGGDGTATPRWFVTRQGETMTVLPPMTFTMGSPPGEPGRDGGPDGPSERQHEMHIGRSFAIATKPVTVGEFLRFRPDHKAGRLFAPTPDCPVNHTTWYLAAEYCNWLSAREGLPPEEWCYVPDADGKYQAGMRLAPDYLKRTGYRLPTEAEWECACRAGAVTARSFGECDELLGEYAWNVHNSENRSHPVGGLKPNDWGLFDMHGNVWVWCQERHLDPDAAPPPAGTVSEDKEDILEVSDKDYRLLRGGSFYNPPAYVRSAERYWYVPTHHFRNIGFRVARTVR
jgi:formylglycine-generating enzyme required for sulfatase activity